ncbi:FmdB family zinc ribbon protein [Cellulomonas sp. NS3]|uniref:FmdB family zinc ribbon protein n=1 Tax=Cellulomonas sp. NS3 TaxID=2973977 RepID=UPI002162B622|nr:FmdB family zinc ribbon protein [Cellulomonas sp. NS3]
MPTYSYACTACGHAFDIQQSFSDESLTVCPECEGRLRKVFSAVGVVFKGSGFYRNDSRSSGTSTSSSGSSSSTSSTSSNGGSSSGSSGSSGEGSSSASTPAKPATSSGSSSTPAAAAS